MTEVDQLDRAAEAFGEPTCMFILSKFKTARDGYGARYLNRVLKAPWGWIAFAMLWRASLIYEQLNRWYITDSGREVLRALDRFTEVTEAAA